MKGEESSVKGRRAGLEEVGVEGAEALFEADGVGGEEGEVGGEEYADLAEGVVVGLSAEGSAVVEVAGPAVEEL